MKKCSVDIAIPVYYGNLDEIEISVKKQVEYFREELKEFEWNIVIAINGKNPEEIIKKSRELAKRYKEVKYTYTPIPGKGAGVIDAWRKSAANILTYMDVDLATDIKDMKPLIKKITKGYDISTGSRYHPKSKVKRRFYRLIVSEAYRIFFTRGIMGARYNDAQCGFKAINKKIVRNILPLIKDHEWFWESEMLWLSQRKGYKITEIPIIWRTTWKTSISNLAKLSLEFMKKSMELRFRKS